MPSLAELLQELRELGISPREINIPDRWYRQLIDQAEDLSDMEDDDD